MMVSVIGFAAACILAFCALTAPSQVRAQQAFEVTPTIEIPRGYSSWSLFLVCNPAWIVQNGDKGFVELFNRYRAFGHAIGPKNLAIWFWKKPAETPTSDNTDVDRSSIYCERYKLLPSESPHVLVTTRYPDDPDPGDRFVVRLNNLDAQDGALALTKLADQLLVTGLSQTELDINYTWRRVLAAVGSAVSATGCYFNKVSFSFKTGIINAEIEHSSNSAGADKGC
jgi:hypothetical protein